MSPGHPNVAGGSEMTGRIGSLGGVAKGMNQVTRSPKLVKKSRSSVTGHPKVRYTQTSLLFVGFCPVGQLGTYGATLLINVQCCPPGNKLTKIAEEMRHIGFQNLRYR